MSRLSKAPLSISVVNATIPYSGMVDLNKVLVVKNSKWTTYSLNIPNLLVSNLILGTLLERFYQDLTPNTHSVILKFLFSTNEYRNIGPTQFITSDDPIDSVLKIFNDSLDLMNQFYRSEEIIQVQILTSETSEPRRLVRS